VGEFAIAIGAPLELDYSVTFGHISAKGRSRILDDPAMDQDFLQTDANINPGNSGGPLVNIDGEVVGINTLIRGMRTGIGFAIPSNLVREITDQLITRGRVVRAYLGIRIRGWRESSEYRAAIPGVKDGVVIFAIPRTGPASHSELKPGDVITAVDSRPVASPQALKNEIRSKKLGTPVVLDVHRFGRNLKLSVRPEAWPAPEETAATRPRPVAGKPKPRALGIAVGDVTSELVKQFGLETNAGVVVTEVTPNSLAEAFGLQAGDIVQSVNLKPVASAQEFKDNIRKADPEKGILLHFASRGVRRFEILSERR
jgi:serine protease Do